MIVIGCFFRIYGTTPNRPQKIQGIKIAASGCSGMHPVPKSITLEVKIKGLGRELNPGPTLVDLVEFPVTSIFFSVTGRPPPWYQLPVRREIPTAGRRRRVIRLLSKRGNELPIHADHFSGEPFLSALATPPPAGLGPTLFQLLSAPITQPHPTGVTIQRGSIQA